MDIELTDEERKAIDALKRLSRRWPKSLWLFSGSGRLCVMRCRQDGLPAMTDEGGVDPDYCLATIGITNDGGDWSPWYKEH